MEEDSINHPSHYTDGPIYRKPECIDLTRDLPFCAGNAIKYIWRSGHKGDWREDLAKARWYWLDRGSYVPFDQQNRALDTIALFDKDNASIEWRLKIRLFEMIVAGIMSNDTREEALAALERHFEETEKSGNTGDCNG